MAHDPKRTLIVLLAVSLLLAVVPATLAYEDEENPVHTHPDMGIASVVMQRLGGFSADDPRENRADFVPGPEDQVLVFVNVSKGTATEDPAKDIAVYVNIEHEDAPGKSAALRDASHCWLIDEMGPDKSSTRVQREFRLTSDPGNVTITAHVNNDVTQANCSQPSWSETVDEDDNEGTWSFVVGEQPDLVTTSDDITWCFDDWAHPGTQVCGDQRAVALDNKTQAQPRDASNLTTFRVDVRNIGSYERYVEVNPTNSDDGNHTGSGWQAWGLAEPDTGAAIPYEVNITLQRDATGTTWYLTPDGENADEITYLRNITSEPWDLAGKRPGNYTVTVRVDDTDHIWEAGEGNNAATFTFRLFGPDLHADINETDLPGDAANALTYSSADRDVHFNTTVANLGDLDSTKPWTWGWFLDEGTSLEDNETGLSATAHGTGYTVATDGETYLTYARNFCDDADRPCYLTPGKHVLEVAADDANDVNELDETNNRDTITFYVEDDAAPIVDAWGSSGKGTVKSGEEVTFSTTLLEDDLYLDNVTLHLEIDPDSGNTTTRTFGASAPERALASHELDDDTAQGTYQYTWTFPNGFETIGTYTYWITAADPSGNAVSTVDSAKSFTVGKWPVNITTIAPTRGEAIPFPNPDNGTADNTPVIIITYINGTGRDISSEAKKFVTRNATRDDDPAFNYTLTSAWYYHSECDSDRSNGETHDPPIGGEAAWCREDAFFQVTSHPADVSEPGRWNVTVHVQDAAGRWSHADTYYVLQDDPPSFDLANTTIEGEDLHEHDDGYSFLEAGETFRVSVRVQDDGLGALDPGERPVEGVFANLTNSTRGFHGNVSLTCVADCDSRNSTWNGTITTGRDGAMAVGGFYNVSFHAVDTNGNWARTDEGDVSPDVIQVQDTGAPVIIDDRSGVDTPQDGLKGEVGEPFTFFAEVLDETKLDVTLTITTPEGSTITRSLHRVGTSDRYEVDHTFDTAGTYRFKIVAEDTAPTTHKDSFQGPNFQVADNLPPGVSVWRPAVQHNTSAYWTDPTPALVASVSDPDDVDQSSIELRVDGTPVNMSNVTVTRLASNTGYNLTYVLPGNYSDGDRIEVEVGATDRSNLNLSGTVTYELLVDGQAPATQAPSFDPKHRAGGHVWNISGISTVLVDADDPASVDGFGSGVTTIFVRLEKEALGEPLELQPGETFRINREFLGDDYMGPGLYKLHYWSEDRVGNQGQEEVVQVRLDTRGPQITPLALGNQHINATINDDQGVARAVLHVREQGDATYTPQPMNFSRTEGLWQAVLPDVPRGTVLEYYLSATDQIGNQGFAGRATNPFTYVEGNKPPTVDFISPPDAANIGGTILVEWEGHDDDEGDELRYTLEYRLAGQGSFRQLAPLNVGETSVDVDTRDLPDGTYELRITVSDGTAFSKDVITVDIENSDVAAEPTPLPKDTFDRGRIVHFTADIRKANANVTLQLSRNGEVVLTAPMRDDGAGGDAVAGDNTFTASVRLADAGTYDWSVLVTYESDGQMRTEEVPGGGSFTVASTATDIFTDNIGLWAAVIILVLAVAAIGGYALTRGRE